MKTPTPEALARPADDFEEEAVPTPAIRQLYEVFGQSDKAEELNKALSQLRAYERDPQRGGDYDKILDRLQKARQAAEPLFKPIFQRNEKRYPEALGTSQEQISQVLPDSSDAAKRAYLVLQDNLFRYEWSLVANKEIVGGEKREWIEENIESNLNTLRSELKEKGVNIKSDDEVLGRLRHELGVVAVSPAAPEPSPPLPEERGRNIERLEKFQDDLDWVRRLWRMVLDSGEASLRLDIDEAGRKYKSDEWAYKSFSDGLDTARKQANYGEAGIPAEEKLRRLKKSFEYTFSIQSGVHAEVVPGREISWQEGFNVCYAKEFLRKAITRTESLPEDKQTEEVKNDLARAKRVLADLEQASIKYSQKYGSILNQPDPFAPPETPDRRLKHQRVKHEAFFVYEYQENGKKLFDAHGEIADYDQAMKQNYYRAEKRFDEWEVVDVDKLLVKEVPEKKPVEPPEPTELKEPTEPQEPEEPTGPKPQPPEPKPPTPSAERPYYIDISAVALEDRDIQWGRETARHLREEDEKELAIVPGMFAWVPVPIPIINIGNPFKGSSREAFGRNFRWTWTHGRHFVRGNAHRFYKNFLFRKAYEDRETMFVRDLQDIAKESQKNSHTPIVLSPEDAVEALRQGEERINKTVGKNPFKWMRHKGLNFVKDLLGQQTSVHGEAKKWLREQLETEADNPVKQAVSLSQQESEALADRFSCKLPINGQRDVVPTAEQIARDNRWFIERGETRYGLSEDKRVLVDQELKQICQPFFTGQIDEPELLRRVNKYFCSAGSEEEPGFLKHLTDEQRKEFSRLREVATNLVKVVREIKDDPERRQHYLEIVGEGDEQQVKFKNFEFNLMFGKGEWGGIRGKIEASIGEKIRHLMREGGREVTDGQGRIAQAVDAVLDIAPLGAVVGGYYLANAAGRFGAGMVARAVPFGVGVGLLTFAQETGINLGHIRLKGRLATEREQVGREVARGRVAPEGAELRKDVEASLPFMREATAMMARIDEGLKKLTSQTTPATDDDVRQLMVHLADADARILLNSLAGEREVGRWKLNFIRWTEGRENFEYDQLAARRGEAYILLENYLSQNSSIAQEVLGERTLTETFNHYQKAQQVNIIGDGEIAEELTNLFKTAGTFVEEADRLVRKNSNFRGLTLRTAGQRGAQAAVASAMMSMGASYAAVRLGQEAIGYAPTTAVAVPAVGRFDAFLERVSQLDTESIKEIGSNLSHPERLGEAAYDWLQERGLADDVYELIEHPTAENLDKLIDQIRQAPETVQQQIGQIIEPVAPPELPPPEVSIAHFQELYKTGGDVPLEDGFRLEFEPDHDVLIVRPDGRLVTGLDIEVQPDGRLIVTGELPPFVRMELEDPKVGFIIRETPAAGPAEGLILEPATPVPDNVVELDTKIPPGTEWVKDLKTDPSGNTWDLKVKGTDVKLIDNARLAENGMLDLKGARVDYDHLSIAVEPGEMLTGEEAVSRWQELGSDYKEEFYINDTPNISEGNELRFHTLVRNGNEVGFDMSKMEDSFQTGLDPNPLKVGDILSHAPGTEQFEPGIYFKIPGLDREVFVPLKADGSDDKILWLSPADSQHTVMLNGQEVTLAEVYQMLVSEKGLADHLAKLKITDKGDIATEVYGAQDVWKLGAVDEPGRIVAAVKMGDTLKAVASIEGTEGVEIPEIIQTIKITKEFPVPEIEERVPEYEVIPPIPKIPEEAPTEVPPVPIEEKPLPTEAVEARFYPIPFAARKAVERSKKGEKPEIKPFEPGRRPGGPPPVERKQPFEPKWPPYEPGKEEPTEKEPIPIEEVIFFFEDMPLDEEGEKKFPREALPPMDTENVVLWSYQNQADIDTLRGKTIDEIRAIVEEEDRRAVQLKEEAEVIINQTYQELDQYIKSLEFSSHDVAHYGLDRVKFLGRYRMMAEAKSRFTHGYFRFFTANTVVNASSLLELSAQQRKEVVKQLVARKILSHELNHARSNQGTWYIYRRPKEKPPFSTEPKRKYEPSPEERREAGLKAGRVGILMGKIRRVTNAAGTEVIGLVPQERGRWLNEVVTEQLARDFFQKRYGERSDQLHAYQQEIEVLKDILKQTDIPFHQFVQGMLTKQGFTALMRRLNGFESTDRKVRINRPYFLQMIYALMEYEQAKNPYATGYSLTRKFINRQSFDQNDRAALAEIIKYAVENNTGNFRPPGAPDEDANNIQLAPIVCKRLRDPDWLSQYYSFIRGIEAQPSPKAPAPKPQPKAPKPQPKPSSKAQRVQLNPNDIWFEQVVKKEIKPEELDALDREKEGIVRGKDGKFTIITLDDKKTPYQLYQSPVESRGLVLRKLSPGGPKLMAVSVENGTIYEVKANGGVVIKYLCFMIEGWEEIYYKIENGQFVSMTADEKKQIEQKIKVAPRK